MLGALAAGAIAQASDINSTSKLYESDEFRLYCFKILPCSRRVPHEWSSCPFAHPSEKAKRRNIRTHSYDCEMCPAVVKGEECLVGPNCPHSHNVFESWLHPQKYRTLLCKDKDKCTRAVCFFAHGEGQLRTPSEPLAVLHTDLGSMGLAPTAVNSLAGLPSSSSMTATLFGSTGSLPLLQLGVPGQQAAVTAGWPQPAATLPVSSPNRGLDMQQMLLSLMDQVQVAQQEAQQQRVAAQHAEQQLRTATAAIAGQQAVACAAMVESAMFNLGLQQDGTLEAMAAAQARGSMDSLAGGGMPLLHPQRASLESVYGVRQQRASMECVPGMLTSLLQTPIHRQASMDSVQSQFVMNQQAAHTTTAGHAEPLNGMHATTAAIAPPNLQRNMSATNSITGLCNLRTPGTVYGVPTATAAVVNAGGDGGLSVLGAKTALACQLELVPSTALKPLPAMQAPQQQQQLSSGLAMAVQQQMLLQRMNGQRQLVQGTLGCDSLAALFYG